MHRGLPERVALFLYYYFRSETQIWAESSKKSSNPPCFDKKVGGIEENFFDSARNVGL